MNKKILLTAAVLLPLSLFGQEKKGPYESDFDLPGSDLKCIKRLVIQS